MLIRVICLFLILLGNSVFSQENKSLLSNNDAPLMGYNAHLSDAPKWNNSDFNQKVSQLNPNTLRYPGGSNSFYWDWEIGWTIPYSRLLAILNDNNFLYEGKKIKDVNEFKKITLLNRKSNPFWRQVYRYNAKTPRPEKLEDFSKALTTHQSKAVFTLNLITSTIENELNMLLEAEKNNISVEYIELGNEINSENLITKHFYPNSIAYVDTCIRWSKKIFEAFPNAKIGVVGGDKNKRLVNWNQNLVEAIEKNFISKKNQFYFILHYYPYLKSPIYDFNNFKQYQQLMAFPKFDLEQRLNWWKWDKTKDFETWVTEYNLIEPQPYLINNRWVHGLFISNLINELWSKTRASVFHYHTLGSKRFPVFSAIDMMSSELNITTSGLVTSLWNRFTQNSVNFKKINSNNYLWDVNFDSKFSCNCPNNPKIPTTVELESLQIFKAEQKGKTVFLITNLSNKYENFNLSTHNIKNINVESYFAELNDKNWSTTNSISEKNVKIPPYSINLLIE